ncbi:MAG: aldo/keto reductase [Sphingomonas sp.]
MEYVRLGRTNQNVSAVGLGCGGHSRLGMARGATTAEAADLVRRAIDLGIDFIDTALVYRTEEAVGLGIAGRDRSSLFLSTKSWVGRGGAETDPEKFTAADSPPTSIRASGASGPITSTSITCTASRSRSSTMRARCCCPKRGASSRPGRSASSALPRCSATIPGHRMLQAALPADDFDVVMVGFNLLNPSARKTVFPLTLANDVGTLVMFAVRRGLNSAGNAREAVAALLDSGEVDPAAINPADPLDFLRAAPGVKSQIEAAYRFCRHEPGAHVILTGTGSAAHLEENIASILAPPLPAEAQAKLKAIFGEVSSASAE